MSIIVDNPKLEQDIPLGRIHPDPFQPRLEPDDELAASIVTLGILQAISIEVIDASNAPDRICPDCGKLFVDLQAEGEHFMLQDGERRFRGAIAAGNKTILAKIVPSVSESRRLIRQLTANTGKPLTPIEEAFAFQRLMDAEGWSQAELARQLGRPRSVIGDRIRLVDLDPVWLNLISSGKLQVSHAPALHLYATVPAKYQAQASEALIKGWLDDRIEPISIAGFEQALQAVFRKYLTPIGEVGAQYNGPIVEVSFDYQGKSKYAADPEVWKPIVSARAKRAREQNKTDGPAIAQSSRNRSALDQFPDLARRKAGESYSYTPAAGEVRVWAESQGWDSSFLGLPSIFLGEVDRTKLARLDFRYGGTVLVTTDAAAVETARAAFSAELKKRVDGHIVELVAQIAKNESRFRVTGPSTRALLEQVSRFGSPLPMLAAALGISVQGLADEEQVAKPGALKISDVDANVLATAYLARTAGAFKVWTSKDLRMELWRKYAHAPLKFPASKKQEKREARAAGTTVGDPSRAKKEREVPIAAAVDVGAIRAAVEADIAEGELEEANA